MKFQYIRGRYPWNHKFQNFWKGGCNTERPNKINSAIDGMFCYGMFCMYGYEYFVRYPVQVVAKIGVFHYV